MKKIIRLFLSNIFIFWFLGFFVPSLNLQSNPKEVISIAFIFTLLEQVIYPILNILFTPINVLTLGIMRWVPMLAVVVLLFLISPFTVEPITIPNIDILDFHLPTIHLGQTSSFVFLTFVLLTLKRIFDWIFKG